MKQYFSKLDLISSDNLIHVSGGIEIKDPMVKKDEQRFVVEAESVGGGQTQVTAKLHLTPSTIFQPSIIVDTSGRTRAYGAGFVYRF
ncbi:MAG: hypothetical protein ACHQJ6_03295 [Candidatus Berkiellales bacterium]